MRTKQEKPKITNPLGLRDSVLKKIECGEVEQKSKAWFMCGRCLVWAFWVIAVIAGSLTFSEAVYMGVHSGVEYYEMTHGSLTAFILDSLPYIWLGALLILIGLAYFNMRNTPRGYRYPMWQIVVSSVVFTVGGGLVLHAAGVSAAIDKMVGPMPGILSAAERQAYMWAHPEDGRITGVYAGSEGPERVRFDDSVGREWIVFTHELPPRDREVLLTGERVRLLGEADIDGESRQFYVCASMPWMPEKGHSIETLKEARQGVNDRIAQFERANKYATSQPSMRCREIMFSLLKKNY